GKPKYSFDRCRIVVDDIMGQIEQSDFAVTLHPSGGDASKDTAYMRNGLLRKIERMSGARYIYNNAARKAVETGMSGWRIVQDWVDSKSMQQDLLIKRVSNFGNRVWFDPGAEEPDMSDADYCFLLTSLTKEDYDRDFPNGSGMSVSDDDYNWVHSYKKPHEVIIGEYLWKKKERRKLVLMSNGAVYVADDEFNKIKDELREGGITVVRDRDAYIDVVHQRIFDGNGWLSGSNKTAFQWLPVIPVYGNFDIVERKVLYEGAVEPLMDAQRVLNYAESRKIEEGALSPREKIMM
ncbi:MAG: hypothetical protein GY954_19940, partial [Alteromonas sp.]|nr:hypothetical protein [Alteromonas sp.]